MSGAFHPRCMTNPFPLPNSPANFGILIGGLCRALRRYWRLRRPVVDAGGVFLGDLIFRGAWSASSPSPDLYVQVGEVQRVCDLCPDSALGREPHAQAPKRNPLAILRIASGFRLA